MKSSLCLLAALLGACMETALSEQAVPVTAVIDVDTTETLASCLAGERLVSGSATCSFTLNAATLTGVDSSYVPSPDRCFCSVNADCGFNDTSTVCAGGSLAMGETYPCGGPETQRGGPFVTLDNTQFRPLDADGCKQACTNHYNALTLTQKNTVARGVCENGIGIASGKREPISCCVP